MLGQSCIDRPDAGPEVSDGLPYADSHAIAGIEDDLPAVLALDVLRPNDIGEFHLLEEEAARPNGCSVKDDAKAIEVDAEQSGRDEVHRNGQLPNEQVRERWLRRQQEAKSVEANEAEERCAPGPLVGQMFVCHKPVHRCRGHDSEA